MWNDPQITELFLKKTPLVDVRSPGEFLSGSISYSVNLPIMNDRERSLVGTCYKKEGQEAAIALGHSIVSGVVKEERISSWISFIKANPEAEFFCFRGGLRSQITCKWINEFGFNKHPINGGFKRLRNYFLSWLDEAPHPKFLRIGGLTGSGKTPFLKKLHAHIDLEALAKHRGSTFGQNGPQPSQVTFENHLALEVMKHSQEKRVVLEDESVTLGKITIPRRFFFHLREAPLIVLRREEEARIKNIFQDYVKGSELETFLNGMDKIKKRIPSSDYQKLLMDLKKSFENGFELNDHEKWISRLLKLYYDPLYMKDLNRNRDKIIFEGNEEEIKDFLSAR